MSYVRLSHDSDFYIYYTGTQFDIILRGARFDNKSKQWKATHNENRPQIISVNTLPELVAEIRRLRKMKYRIPRKVFDTIKRDCKVWLADES